MPVIPFDQHIPTIGKDCFIAPTAWVTGQTTIADNVSIFFGAVLRGDINAVKVGSGTNIQENALLHTSSGLGDCQVGSNVTIGHHAIIHGCTIGDNCIIGMGAVVLDQAVIGNNCLIGAQSLITMKTKIPDGSLVFGNPARIIRSLTVEEVTNIKNSAQHYITVGSKYAKYFENV